MQIFIFFLVIFYCWFSFFLLPDLFDGFRDPLIAFRLWIVRRPRRAARTARADASARPVNDYRAGRSAGEAVCPAHHPLMIIYESFIKKSTFPKPLEPSEVKKKTRIKLGKQRPQFRGRFHPKHSKKRRLRQLFQLQFQRRPSELVFENTSTWLKDNTRHLQWR